MSAVHVKLATGVIILPQRQTALFAKQAADVDLFSDGRLRLGVGVGWLREEFQALGAPDFDRRGAVSEAEAEESRPRTPELSTTAVVSEVAS